MQIAGIDIEGTGRRRPVVIATEECLANEMALISIERRFECKIPRGSGTGYSIGRRLGRHQVGIRDRQLDRGNVKIKMCRLQRDNLAASGPAADGA